MRVVRLTVRLPADAGPALLWRIADDLGTIGADWEAEDPVASEFVKSLSSAVRRAGTRLGERMLPASSETSA